MLHRLRSWLAPDLAIDLGTAYTRIAIQGQGIVLEEPSVVALQKGSRRVLGRGTAVGKLARQMLGRTPDGMIAVRPLQRGVIGDFELCEAMLRYFLRKVARTTPGMRGRAVVVVPGGITPVEQRAVYNSLERAGAGRIFLLKAAKAAALGTGLPISEPLASLVCNIGAGTTEIAVFSLGEMVASRSLRLAGDELDDALVSYVHRHFSLRIGPQMAEQVKRRIGSAAPLDQEQSCEVRGLDVVSSVPRKAMITSEEVREALKGPLMTILAGIRSVIEQCDPELVADLADTGLMLTGGTAMLPGLAEFFQSQLGIPVRGGSDPQRAILRGTSLCLEHLRHWKESPELVSE